MRKHGGSGCLAKLGISICNHLSISHVCFSWGLSARTHPTHAFRRAVQLRGGDTVGASSRAFPKRGEVDPWVASAPRRSHGAVVWRSW